MIADGFGLSEQTKAPGEIVGRLCFWHECSAYLFRVAVNGIEP